jgi:acetyltransferase-like isoleucine patch superfamily enzyme
MSRRTLVENFIILLNDIKAWTYTKLLSSSLYAIGKKSMIIPPLRFGNLSEIQLGEFVTIHSNCWIQALRNNDSNRSEPKLIIKDRASIGMNATISAAKSIIIEEDVFTARNVYISDHSHKYDDIDRPIALQSIESIAEVKIGASTWLGQNAIILPGVMIGKHCVVGANSVVNKDIPDFSIVVGVPAKVIKRYDPQTDSWSRVR